jgi:hypothetical protein
MYHFGGHLGGSGQFLAESDMVTTLNTAVAFGGGQPVINSGNTVSGYVGIVSVQDIHTVTYTLTLVGMNNNYTTAFTVSLGSFNNPSGSGAEIFPFGPITLPSTLNPGMGMGITVSTSNGAANNEEIQVNLILQ